MEWSELNCNEASLVEILREFKFLTKFGYSVSILSFYSHSLPSLEYHNYSLRLKIQIIGADLGTILPDYSIVFIKHTVISTKAFSVEDYFAHFGNNMNKGGNYTLRTLSDFIQKQFLPIIQGEIWIDELIQQRK